MLADAAHATVGWQSVAFTGSEVSLVAVNPYQQDEVLAVVNGQAKLTLDGGIFWRNAPIPSMVTAVVFDPVRPGDMYAGTQRGIYRSTDLGLSWQAFGNEQSQVLATIGLAANTDAIFTTESAGVGSAVQMYRIDRSGNSTDVAVPSGSVGALATDLISNALYAGTQNTMYRSNDDGVTWQAVAGVGQIGAYTNELTAHGGGLWQSSVDGIYYSANSGSNWINKASYPAVTELYPSLSSSLHGLAVNNGNAFFGIRSPWYRIHEVFEVAADGPVKLGFPDYPNDVATGNGHLWVAGDSGLWRQEGLVSSEAVIKRPVIVIPGIMGSWKVAGKWVLDPITHAYDPMLAALRADGYADNQTLFGFPYEWRQDVSISAGELAVKIGEVKKICGCSKVDIVGHSMGGLVARAYIEGDNYLGDVENLVELGTPNAGSVEDYSLWEAGVSVDRSLLLRLELKLFNLEALENGYTHLTDYVRSEVASVADLLPIFNYLNGRTYPNGYPRNFLLEDLNQPSKMSLLKSRVHLFVVGSQTKQTLTSLEIGSQNQNNNWPDGQILHRTYGSGDGTVPIASLTSLAQASLLLDEDHGGLATHPNQLWISNLVGDIVPIQNNPNTANKMLLIYVKSPVRISVTDPNGNQLNDSANQISGAFFSGSDASVQFATIPSPINGSYQIKLTGKGTGSYTIGVSTINDDSSLDTEIEKSGTTVITAQDTYVYDYQPGQLTLASSIRPTDSSISSVPTVAGALVSSTIPTAPETFETATSINAAFPDSPRVTPFEVISSLPAPILSRKDLKATELIHNSGKRLAIFTLMLSGIIVIALWLLRKLKQVF